MNVQKSFQTVRDNGRFCHAGVYCIKIENIPTEILRKHNFEQITFECFFEEFRTKELADKYSTEMQA